MAIDKTQYPQLAKMDAVREESQAIGEFIEWLNENGMAICTHENGLRGESFFLVMESVESLLARHFDVDLNAVERERRAVLASCVEANATRASGATA